MNGPLTVLVSALILVVMGLAIITLQVWLLYFAISKFKREDLTQLKDNVANALLHQLSDRGVVNSQWLTSNGFKLRGVFQPISNIRRRAYFDSRRREPHSARFVVFQRERERTCIWILILPLLRIQIDIVTAFNDGSLTTSTNRHFLKVPVRRGRWVQAFSASTVDPLWERHEDALDFLRQATGQRPSTAVSDALDDLIGQAQESAAYIRSLSWWTLRVPFWILAGRSRLFGIPVREQYERFGVGLMQQFPGSLAL